MSLSPPSLSPALSHTRIYLLWTQRQARPKTLEVEVCQYFKERPNQLGVNLLAAGNATPLTPYPPPLHPPRKMLLFPHPPPRFSCKLLLYPVFYYTGNSAVTSALWYLITRAILYWRITQPNAGTFFIIFFSFRVLAVPWPSFLMFVNEEGVGEPSHRQKS